MPITGYNDEPLTTLENAIKPVRDRLANIDRAIQISKENVRNRHNPLSIDEAASIQLYTIESLPLGRCLYHSLNQILRSATRRDLIPWFSYLKLIMTGLWKLPSYQGDVWRGIKGINLSKQYEEAECYTWWNFSSCTAGLTVLEKSNFLGSEGERTLFHIQCLYGKDIGQYSYVRNEKEILLMPGTYFKVTGKISPAPGLVIIDIQEILPPYELISPPF